MAAKKRRAKKHSIRTGRRLIETTYQGATGGRGSRVRAVAYGGKLTVPYDSGMSDEQNFDHAATALAEKMNWLDGADLVSAGLPKGSGRGYIVLSKK